MDDHDDDFADDPEPVPDAELFLDDRGSLLRVRWSAERDAVVLSVWRDGRCVATHTLAAQDATRMSALLTHAWVESLRRSLTSS